LTASQALGFGSGGGPRCIKADIRTSLL
jgi:hypothetical protein